MEYTILRNNFPVQYRYFRPQSIKGILGATVLFLSVSILPAQSPYGTWITIDDKRQVDIAHVRIYKEGGKLHAKVVKLLPEARNRICKGCPGEEKNRSIEGMVLIQNMEQNKDKYWSNGTFFDPNSGRKYHCSLWLDSEDELKVRVSLGLSILGRTQTWRRLE